MSLKQHVFREHDDRCLYCDVYAPDPDATDPCEHAPDSAPDFEFDLVEELEQLLEHLKERFQLPILPVTALAQAIEKLTTISPERPGLPHEDSRPESVEWAVEKTTGGLAGWMLKFDANNPESRRAYLSGQIWNQQQVNLIAAAPKLYGFVKALRDFWRDGPARVSPGSPLITESQDTAQQIVEKLVRISERGK